MCPTFERDKLSFSLLFGGNFGHQRLYVWRLLHQSMGDKWSKSASDTSFLQFNAWLNLPNRIAFYQHQRIGNRAPSISGLFIRSDQIQYSELIIPDFQLQVIIMPRVLCSINCFYQSFSRRGARITYIAIVNLVQSSFAFLLFIFISFPIDYPILNFAFLLINTILLPTKNSPSCFGYHKL